MSVFYGLVQNAKAFEPTAFIYLSNIGLPIRLRVVWFYLCRFSLADDEYNYGCANSESNDTDDDPDPYVG